MWKNENNTIILLLEQVCVQSVLQVSHCYHSRKRKHFFLLLINTKYIDSPKQNLNVGLERIEKMCVSLSSVNVKTDSSFLLSTLDRMILVVTSFCGPTLRIIVHPVSGYSIMNQHGVLSIRIPQVCNGIQEKLKWETKYIWYSDVYSNKKITAAYSNWLTILY